MSLITLIGYRGSGKSSVAAPLAEQRGYDWIDADDEIERVTGKTIAEIFAEGGEPHFRQIERSVMQQLLSGDQRVIAAGGGAILNDQTRAEMKQAGPVIWLKADAADLIQRIDGDSTTGSRRPALTASNSQLEEVETLLAQRDPLYRDAATLTIETGGKTVSEIVAEIIAALDADS